MSHDDPLQPDPAVRLGLNAAGSLIREAVRAKQAFSLIRLGDGEAAFLGFPDHMPRDRHDHFLRVWWGTDRIGEDHLARLKADVFAATASADILGIPAHDHPTRPDMRAVWSIVRDNRLHGPQTRLASALIAIRLEEAGFWPGLVKDQPVIGLISPNAEVAGTLRDWGARAVRHIPIAGEHRWFNGGSHFPDQYEATLARIEVEEPGMVWLIGAGICGKVYADAVKRRGGIGLDLGSILDKWAGRITRQAFRPPAPDSGAGQGTGP